MPSRLRVAVLISGRGSNLKALIDACAAPDYPAQIVLVISNAADAGGLLYAKDAGIPTAIVEHQNFASRESFDAAMQTQLDQSGAELICLAGFMRILSDGFVRHWQGRMINIHPSLLPAFKGTHVHEQAIAAGVRISGCTVHYVTPELDCGPAIAQAAVPVDPGDTPETLAARVLEAEHGLYPLALRLIAEGRVRLADGRVLFSDVQNAQGVLFNPISR
ncbi:MAG TPA: phosphoribosylglycinamide formyltransferase [Micropepsaceae bacterium]|jgi:phosphoribosylglycinamide formyltransferase-1|nr:phosphoribosylglycinamide formyltransferase [Micropepsaceae bacterium]